MQPADFYDSEIFAGLWLQPHIGNVIRKIQEGNDLEIIVPDIPILMVDDRPENLLSLEGLLSNQGYQLTRALSGNEALRLTLKHSFALVLMDAQMPEMDGFEAAELMRANARTRHIPIIFVTAGLKDLHYQFKGYEAGAVDYLEKPIEPLFLQSKVRVFAELYRQRSELEQHRNHLEHLVELRTAHLDTAKKLAEEMSHEAKKQGDMLHLILNSTAEAIYGIDMHGNCAFCNQAFLNIFGYTCVEELIGKNMHDQIGYFYPTPRKGKIRNGRGYVN